MNSPDFFRFTPEQRATYYDERKSLYAHVISSGTVSMNILFPEILAEYTPRQILSLPLNPETMNMFKDTMNFLGVYILSLPQNIRDLPEYLRQNAETYILVYEYKRRLNNDDLFRALFIKTFQVKYQIVQRMIDLRRHHEAYIGDDDSEYSEYSEHMQSEDSDSDSGDNDGDESESPEETEYEMPSTLVSREIPSYSKQLEIEDSHTGFDPIEGDKPVKTHIEESPDNIVFVIVTKSAGNSYFLSSKEQLKELIKNRSNIQYVCKKYGPHILAVYQDDIYYDKPLFKLSSVGIPTPYVYLSEIKALLESHHQIYVISDNPVERPIALASDDMLTAEDITSGIHCQHKEGDVPYSVYSLSYLDDNDEDTDTLVDIDSDEDTLVSSSEDEYPRKRIRAGIAKKNTRKNSKRNQKKFKKETRTNKKAKETNQKNSRKYKTVSKKKNVKKNKITQTKKRATKKDHKGR